MSELEKVKCVTPDLAEETAKKILALLPECAGEGGMVDIEKLKQCLSSRVIEGNVERYEFTWPGKRAAKAAASAATTKTLRPCRQESVGKDGTPGNFDSENLYIEGDNLEVLKLLQTSYANQVKMIYIDPPYNTGHDFVYRDRFSLTQKELDDNAGAFDEDGNRFEVNDSAEARYHSNWCSMMYPRLKLARNLLRDDGVIFISIDDNEVTNMRKLCDEVFGESNFVALLVWKSRQNKDNRNKTGASIDHEYVVVFSKTPYSRVLIGDGRNIDAYSNPDNDPRGPWASANMVGLLPEDQRPNCHYDLIDPNTGINYGRPKLGWRYDKNTMSRLIEEGRIIWPTTPAGRPRKKSYLNELTGEASGHSSIIGRDIFTRDGTSEINELFGYRAFDFPKPTQLIKELLFQSSTSECIVLDFFSGSAASAHAIMQLNAEDGGNRKFIMVQLPEPCDEDSEAAKAGYANICEIGKERIRRAGAKIREENALTAPNLDIGFRVLKLDSSSLVDTSATPANTTQDFKLFERIKMDRTPEDLLFQILLETHLALTDPIEVKEVGGNRVFFVAGNALVACLDDNSKMSTQFFEALAKLKPALAFFRDDTFADDSSRTNVAQVFAQFSPNTTIKVI